MDEPRPPFEALAHRLQGPHKDFRPEDLPADFVPLRLVLQPGGLSVELTRPDVLLGRHSEADVRLALPDVSRRHCRFVFQDGQWRVSDLNSLNGLFVNGEQMQETNLYDGDELRLGGFTFLVCVGPAPRIGAQPEPNPQVEMLRSIADVLPEPAEAERRQAS
jgi:pSer/pThr/pTyr-binding forkhead associated (FHA) protein